MPDSTIAKLAAELGPAVIGLREGSRGGSGVIVAAGVAVTLARNVHRDELTVRVGNVDLAARVAGSDPTVDLAVLRFESPSDGPPTAVWGSGWRSTPSPTPQVAACAPVTARSPARPSLCADLPDGSSRAPSSTPRRCRADRAAVRS
jgi:hypothetical protein